jgi:DNA helicase HerA-like ATPase
MSRLTFDELVTRRSVLSFHNLPNDDGLKRAIAELLLVQVQAHMLRGDQPRALRRLLVFDEAWRASDSNRLISIAREGRAFGAGIIAGSQFADDLASELTGNLATRVHLFNSDADRRRKIVQSTYGSTASAEAKTMLDRLQKLTPFDAIIRNQHFTPFASFRVVPYFQRKFD